jgi:hypothetical protein
MDTPRDRPNRPHFRGRRPTMAADETSAHNQEAEVARDLPPFYPVSCTTRMPCRSAIRALGQRATAAR